jgi:hypothetical protein
MAVPSAELARQSLSRTAVKLDYSLFEGISTITAMMIGMGKSRNE